MKGVFDETDGKEIVKKKLPLIYHYDGKRVRKYKISIHEHRYVTKRIKL